MFRTPPRYVSRFASRFASGLRTGIREVASRRGPAAILLLAALLASTAVPARGDSGARAAASTDSPAPEVSAKRGWPRPQDQLWLVSTRHLGSPTCRDPAAELDVRRYDFDGGWEPSDLESLLAARRSAYSTQVYVHGNRVEGSEAMRQGHGLYRRLVRGTEPIGPLCFVIWSWPSSQIPGQLRDVRVKAQRTNTDAYYLGWLLSQWDLEQPTSLIGYSFGSRIITGALHLRGGGMLAGRVLPALDENAPDESEAVAASGSAPAANPVRVVMLAPAVHSHWLAPGHPHQLATAQMDRLLLFYNSCDRVLKRYGFVDPGSHPDALGYVGLRYSTALAWDRIEQSDACCIVGKPHEEQRYYQAPSLMRRIQRHVLWSDGEQDSAEEPSGALAHR